MSKRLFNVLLVVNALCLVANAVCVLVLIDADRSPFGNLLAGALNAVAIVMLQATGHEP